MSYLVIARKYRPETFRSVSGQLHVTKTLQNSIVRDQVGHAYVFCGPRGVGKTSVARIFAKSLNCEKGPTAEPCGECKNCEEIALGNSLAVREIDGASHNSVENVRELIESFRTLPAPGSRYKVYIIDEVHMLSLSAFNALLKSLEEPPPNTVFILATTEPQKIPDTVLSRCQRHDFRSLALAQITSRLEEVATAEKIQVEPEVLRMIAKLAQGSMRDAQTLLDRVRAFSDDETISASSASQALGTVETTSIFQISASILDRKPEKALAELESIFQLGIDTGILLREFVGHFRELLVAKFAGEQALAEFGIIEDEAGLLMQHVESVSSEDLQDLAEMARRGADEALRSAYPKYALEALVVRMGSRLPVKEVGEILQRMRGGLKQLDSEKKKSAVRR